MAKVFHQIGNHLEKEHANPYRVRAYHRAAELIVRLTEPIETIAKRGELEALPGIGPDLAQKIRDYLKHGSLDEAAILPLPPHIQAWRTLPGLTDAIIHHLYFRLKIRTHADLAKLARAKLLRWLPEFQGSEQALLEALELNPPHEGQGSSQDPTWENPVSSPPDSRVQ